MHIIQINCERVLFKSRSKNKWMNIIPHPYELNIRRVIQLIPS